MDNPSVASLYRSRLVHLLSGFNPSGIEVSSRYFADRFGQLVGLSGSVMLLMTHEELSATVFKPDGIPAEITVEAIKDEFLRVRTALVRSIAVSFVPVTGHGRDTLPTPDGLHAHFQLTGVYAALGSGTHKIHATAYEPFQKFYMARQQDLEIKIQHLRSFTGDAISGLSPELAQLSKLDASLGNVLAVRTRDLFGVVPKLLGKRFGGLLDEHWRMLPNKPTAFDLEQWMRPGGWISTFCGEMREMLLAELEVRLQPVLGMIDALPETCTDKGTRNGGKNQNRD